MAERAERRSTGKIAARTKFAAKTISDRTYRKLTELIEAHHIQPGQILEERRLAEQLRVSRTPMRAAMSRLEGEGVLVRLSNGLPAVREVGGDEFLELLHLRKLLEPEATELAVGRIPQDELEEVRRAILSIIEATTASNERHWLLDDRIHDLIAERCRNRSLGSLVQNVRRRARMCNIERNPSRLIPACREHLAIVDALLAGQRTAARSAMTTHLEKIRAAFLTGLVPES